MSRVGDIPGDVIAVLDTYVDSLTALEVLMMLARDPSRTWTAARAAAQIGVAQVIAQRELDRLARLGFTRQSADDASRYLFAPADSERVDAVRRLDACYRTYRVSVINYVASRALKRIQTLADAFRLDKKGNKDEP